MNLLDLNWLPEPAADFRAQVRALRDTGTNTGADAGTNAGSNTSPDFAATLRRLATAQLNLTQLHSLSQLVEKIPDVKSSAWTNVTLLSNATTDLIASALPATALRHELLLKAHTTPFGTFNKEALDPASTTNQSRPDFVVLALDHRAFDFSPVPGDVDTAQRKLAAALETLRNLAAALRAHSGAAVVVQTLAAPLTNFLGSFENQLPGTTQWFVDNFNAQVRAWREPGILLLDVAALAAQVGLAQWHDPTQWAVGKFSFAHAAVPLYAEHLSRIFMAAKGKAKKCLVLDLDNTLWGGVIGDDGMNGIVLGQGSPLGEAFLSIQATALELRSRGIVLAVSSKNDEAVARRVFKEHPEMLLREEHIAVFQANWNDKASNLKAIAETLNIGINALAFLDDNPAERQQVRGELPMVGVPELPDAPELYPAMLLAAGYFEAVGFTDEDRQRAGQYQANAARAAVLSGSSDLGAYLESLEMVADMRPFDDVGRARIAQLINKTNQFNLTTRRYTEGDVEAFENDPAVFTLQIRLKDRFGDNGMISVLICKPEGEDGWRIDTWLMSCRVLNRGLEKAVLNVLVAAAKSRGIVRIIGEYLPTEKNGMVKEHYPKLGFAPLSDDPAAPHWVCSVPEYQPFDVAVKIVETDLVGEAAAQA